MQQFANSSRSNLARRDRKGVGAIAPDVSWKSHPRPRDNGILVFRGRETKDERGIPTSRVSAIARRFGAWQSRRPVRPLALGVLLTLAAGWLAADLDLRTEFELLLPEHQPSVIELRRLQRFVPNLSRAYIVLEGENTSRLRAAGDALVPRLLKLSPEVVSGAETGVHDGRGFLLARAGLFASVEALERLRAEVELRFRRAVARGMGADLEEDASEPPPLTARTVKEILGIDALAARADRFPDGYYQSADGRALVVAVHTPVIAGQQARAKRAVEEVRGALDAAAAEGITAGLRVSLAGDLVTGLYEYDAILTDLVRVGALGVSLVLLV